MELYGTPGILSKSVTPIKLLLSEAGCESAPKAYRIANTLISLLLCFYKLLHSVRISWSKSAIIQTQQYANGGVVNWKIGLLAAALSGCANLATIGRNTDLPGGGKAIHLDSAQRLVYADSKGRLCAEPTPDALQSYAAALGASVGIDERGAASLSNALNANAASVGLHTQSITLMRDTLYRICEYSHNANVENIDVVQLLQRSQDLTLGALAIEQLTGAVVARQALLSGSAASDSAASINNTQAQVDVAQKNVSNKQDQLSKALTAEQAQQSAVGAAKQALEAANAKVPKDEKEIKAASDILAAEEITLQVRIADVANSKTNLERASAALAAIENMLAAAIAASKATATGSGSFTSNVDNKNIDQFTVEHIAKATTEIVQLVLTKGHATDTCLAFLTRSYAGSPEYADVKAQCKEVINAFLDNYRAGHKVPAPAPAPGIAQVVEPLREYVVQPTEANTPATGLQKPLFVPQPVIRPKPRQVLGKP